MDALLEEHRKCEDAHLGHAVDDCQRVIDLLVSARTSIAAESQSASMILAKLNHPMKQSFEKINDDLKATHSARNAYTKVLDKKFKDKTLRDVESDALSSQSQLINRAIAMHLLREGQFSVASTFLKEAEPRSDSTEGLMQDVAMKDTWEKDIANAKLHSVELQEQFADMYHILHEMKQRKNLAPAIQWARNHSKSLDHRGSNLEFDLCRLQFSALFMGHDLEDTVHSTNSGPVRAWAYAREEFSLFQHRYLKEISQLMGSIAFSADLSTSPYQQYYNNASAWEDVANSFTREFCSLLGLSADSPLYIAATAGAIALPTLVKLRAIMKDKRTEWTTEDELPVDTPLPPGYQFHSIFVCPVSKEQSTEANPPMMMPCGHVICKESLERISKNSRFKCPYCPSESHFQDAKQVYL
ncbi:MAG: hypothetical protein M1821_001482 [Bathelium mastoideum]|nr:MAG: hypothetical protein M1821_001482 [Bathelium mastoideum]